jgi:hypothetical protein
MLLAVLPAAVFGKFSGSLQSLRRAGFKILFFQLKLFQSFSFWNSLNHVEFSVFSGECLEPGRQPVLKLRSIVRRNRSGYHFPV